MKRSILALVVGIVVWVLVASLLDRGLRLVLEGYAAAEPKMAFTLTMMVARLVLAAITSLSAGVAAGAIAPFSRWVPWVLGGILLLGFLPAHVRLWNVFPIWYHLTFLVTLMPLVVLGAEMTHRRAPAAAA